MKSIWFLVFVFSSIVSVAQSINPTNRSGFASRVFEAEYVERPPIFLAGRDSLQRFYYSHFPILNEVVDKAVEQGDTAKFIRIYFSFVVDKSGVLYNAKFEKIASTKYASGSGAKTIKYFNEDKTTLNDAIKKMIQKMPMWRPALQYNNPVDCRVEDYLQFWVGINPPPR